MRFHHISPSPLPLCIVLGTTQVAIHILLSRQLTKTNHLSIQVAVSWCCKMVNLGAPGSNSLLKKPDIQHRSLQIRSRKQSSKIHRRSRKRAASKSAAQSYLDLAQDFVPGMNPKQTMWRTLTFLSRVWGFCVNKRTTLILQSDNQEVIWNPLNIHYHAPGRTQGQTFFTPMKRPGRAPGSVGFFSFCFEQGRKWLKINKVSKLVCGTGCRSVWGQLRGFWTLGLGCKRFRTS